MFRATLIIIPAETTLLLSTSFGEATINNIQGSATARLS
jgi:hypothetical protein